MLARLALLALALSLALAGCGFSPRSGPRGVPPLASQDAWASQRIEAVLDLYPFTEEGQDAVRRMRVLHMRGRPGWFGSTGYGNFVGIGQARPSSIVHELSHSFWGAFPVMGRPDLSWEVPSGEKLSPGMAALRRDLDTFMQQPPDGYEPLRARLRLIPDLITGGFPGLYHLGEAEIVHFTGANLNLVPTILRKYYAPWLEPGSFQAWDQAIRWYLSLPPDQRRIADAFIGVGDLPLDGYAVAVDPKARAEPQLAAVVAQEERLRLRDFVQQFDLYFKPIDGRPVASDFRFWRGYLREMAELYRAHPEAVGGRGSRPRQIREALDFLIALQGLPSRERQGFARRRLLEDRFLLKFAPALDHRTLAQLLSAQEGELERRVASLLGDALQPDYRRYLISAVQLLAEAERHPEEAALAFQRLIGSLDKEQLKQMNFILEVYVGLDRALTRRLLTNLSPETMRVIVKEGPAFVRFLLEPEELAQALGFGGGLDFDRLAELARLTNEHVAGSASVDEPFLNAVYRRVIDHGTRSPGEALEVFAKSGLLVEPFLANFPRRASALVAAEPAVAAQAFRQANPVRLPPARAVYLLIQADPAVAARLTLQYEQMGDRQAVEDALVFFAYDALRLRQLPGLSVSLEKDALFLLHLTDSGGEKWLGERLTAALQRHALQMGPGEGDDFRQAYRETLTASLSTLPNPATRQRMEKLVLELLP